ncbi:MAG: peptide-methionine (S)-S-oxide reductase MsrA [Cyclobacteriaceae bacterium]|nr:peptide-methionine (S)-S-oxide reductase MsrA [Cyclobacteriaceae bacterium]
MRSVILILILLLVSMNIASGIVPERESSASIREEMATFGAGCFWCVEVIFQNLEGVKKIVSGYSGGELKNPTYREVCEGTTGHVEVVQVYYDPAEISFEELLEVFWGTHDPTTLNRQGNDVGTQYRSVIFYHDHDQRKLAEYFLKKLDDSGAYENPVVTAIEPYRNFYQAEDYHQNYFNLNPQLPYCKFVIEPKLEKFKKVFADKLKE